MQNWDEMSISEREQVPYWLVEFSQLWAADSAARYPQEFANWRALAEKDGVPPFVVVLRIFRDTYGVSPTTTKEAFKEQTRKQAESHGGEMYLQYKG